MVSLSATKVAVIVTVQVSPLAKLLLGFRLNTVAAERASNLVPIAVDSDSFIKSNNNISANRYVSLSVARHDCADCWGSVEIDVYGGNVRECAISVHEGVVEGIRARIVQTRGKLHLAVTPIMDAPTERALDIDGLSDDGAEGGVVVQHTDE
jgi:hypothetical protein